jgi:hypothetical protein
MSKIGQVAPRKISVQLCQVRLVIKILFNVCNGSILKFGVRQKCA